MMHTVRVQAQCARCGKYSHVDVYEHQYEEWQDGALIQDVMPNLTTEEHEILATGLCVKCQNLIFEEPLCSELTKKQK